ncbi:MAG: redoxin domain-containing protein [Desulfuromonadales bacterium]|nr:redoxin domain-containing protein [Desulfuromonadales bacterium]
MRRILGLLCAVALLWSSAAVAAGGRPQGAPSTVKVGQSAPDFTLKDLQGNQVSLSSLRGKVVFLNFWATWCPPCREEMPAMERLHAAMGGKDFMVVAVNVEDNLSVVRNYLEKNPHAFTILLDPQAQAQQLFNVYRFPETYLIDKQGKIVEHYIGARDWSSVQFLKYVSSLVNE